MNQIPYRTNYWIWGIASGCIFLALGFVDPLVGLEMEGFSLWSRVGILVRGAYFCSLAEMLASITFPALPLTVPAALLGWVVQAFVVVAWSSSQAAPPRSGDGSKAFGTSAIKRLDI